MMNMLATCRELYQLAFNKPLPSECEQDILTAGECFWDKSGKRVAPTSVRLPPIHCQKTSGSDSDFSIDWVR